MDVYILQVSLNGQVVIGIYSTREKAQEEADNHAASIFQITTLMNATPGAEDQEIRVYGAKDRQLVNYYISRFTVDAEAIRINNPFP